MPKIYSIGIGPGVLDSVTLTVQEILDEVDTVFGYSRLIHHIKPLLEGKAIYTSGLNQERELVEKAIEIAKSGKDIAVISQGDSGIFGLGVVLQQMLTDHPDIELILIPGLPEFVSAASILGTPLTDGFAAISLSTRLTPAETILFRVRLLAQTDLTTVLYYPAEKDSQQMLRKVLDIFADSRPPDTAVALVVKPHRKEQETLITPLESFIIENISEFSLIYIGAEDCRIVDGKILGRRGYII
ncbi:precorrin-3B C(17)-methyltransferase [candidate division KSB1 bacterium]|nr:precorrin-3B C(17)-methyltransferase [candidate division KSB1 bacterium]